MSYYAAPAIALQFYEMPLRDRIEFRFLRHVPVWVDRGMLWAEVEEVAPRDGPGRDARGRDQ